MALVSKLSERGCSSAGRAPALQAGGHRFDPVHLHQKRDKQAAATSGRLLVTLLRVRDRSLTIHRVESALLLERIERCTVPTAIIDCVTKLQLLNAAREGGAQKVMKNGNNANTHFEREFEISP